MKEIAIGVVGYSGQKFDFVKADGLLAEAFEQVFKQYQGHTFAVISGLTNIGVPALAYRQAAALGLRTVGVACAAAMHYPCFPVDKKVIVGENWGDESQAFLDRIDVLIRIGGGKQSHAEVAMAKVVGVPVYEFELEAIAA